MQLTDVQIIELALQAKNNDGNANYVIYCYAREMAMQNPEEKKWLKLAAKTFIKALKQDCVLAIKEITKFIKQDAEIRNNNMMNNINNNYQRQFVTTQANMPNSAVQMRQNYTIEQNQQSKNQMQYQGKTNYDMIQKASSSSIRSKSNFVLCPKCGKTNNNNARFCLYCGAPLNNTRPLLKHASLPSSTVPKESHTSAPQYQPTPSNKGSVNKDLSVPKGSHTSAPQYQPTPSNKGSVNKDLSVPQSKSLFFSCTDYVIDEKVSFMKFANAYRVYDTNGNKVASVQQVISGGAKAARFLIGKSVKIFQSLSINILDENDITIASIKRNGNIFNPNIIYDASANMIAKLKRDKKIYYLTDSHDQLLCMYEFKNFLRSNCTFCDPNGNVIATMQKKWNGAKEIFTDADRYLVHIDQHVIPTIRIAIFCSIILIDMYSHEN